MEMICQGPNCGIVFEAKRKTAKYHDKACSVRASRAGQLGEPTAAPATAPGPGRSKRAAVPVKSLLEKYTRAELAKVKRVDTSAGQAALVLAARIDQGGAETGSALASMISEHAKAMDRATAEAAPDDPVKARQDEVARIRERHARTG